MDDISDWSLTIVSRISDVLDEFDFVRDALEQASENDDAGVMGGLAGCSDVALNFEAAYQRLVAHMAAEPAGLLNHLERLKRANLDHLQMFRGPEYSTDCPVRVAIAWAGHLLAATNAIRVWDGGAPPVWHSGFFDDPRVLRRYLRAGAAAETALGDFCSEQSDILFSGIEAYHLRLADSEVDRQSAAVAPSDGASLTPQSRKIFDYLATRIGRPVSWDDLPEDSFRDRNTVDDGARHKALKRLQNALSKEQKIRFHIVISEANRTATLQEF